MSFTYHPFILPKWISEKEHGVELTGGKHHRSDGAYACILGRVNQIFLVKSEWQYCNVFFWMAYFRSTPHPVTVTTRIITFLVGNPYKLSFATVTGWGVDPRHIVIWMAYLLLMLKTSIGMLVARTKIAPWSQRRGWSILHTRNFGGPTTNGRWWCSNGRWWCSNGRWWWQQSFKLDGHGKSTIFLLEKYLYNGSEWLAIFPTGKMAEIQRSTNYYTR